MRADEAEVPRFPEGTAGAEHFWVFIHPSSYASISISPCVLKEGVLTVQLGGGLKLRSTEGHVYTAFYSSL